MFGNSWRMSGSLIRPDRKKIAVAGGDRFDAGDSYLRVKSRRVIRGGSYDGDPVNLWTEYRDSHLPENAKDFVGFRCADLTPGSASATLILPCWRMCGTSLLTFLSIPSLT